MVHKRIVETALARLDEDRANYFHDVVNRLGEDPRTQRSPNMVYLVLKETMGFLPTLMPKDVLIDLLFDFVKINRMRLIRLVFGEKFIHDPLCVREITNDFVHLVTRLRPGQIQGG